MTVAPVDEPLTDIRGIAEAAGERIEQAGAIVTWRILSGSAGTELLHVVEDLQPDILALGTRGRSGFGRMGSTVKRVIRHVECSVLIAHRSISDIAMDR